MADCGTSEPHIVVIGTASLDTIHVAGQTAYTIGGAGLYTALAVHRVGVRVGLYAPRPEPMPALLQPVAERLDWFGPAIPPEALPRLEIAHHGEGRATLVDASWGAEWRLSQVAGSVGRFERPAGTSGEGNASNYWSSTSNANNPFDDYPVCGTAGHRLCRLAHLVEPASAAVVGASRLRTARLTTARRPDSGTFCMHHPGSKKRREAGGFSTMGLNVGSCWFPGRSGIGSVCSASMSMTY